MKLIPFMFAVLFASAAQADPFASGDANIGKQMVEKNCIACHAANFGGDGSAIYTRDNRIIKTASGLIQQIRNCNTNLGLKWFDDDEMNVAKFLNQNYYHFQ